MDLAIALLLKQSTLKMARLCSSPFVRKRALRSSLYAAFQHAVKIVPSAEIAVQDPLLLLLLLPTSIGDGDGGVKLKRDDASSGGEKKRTPAKLSLDLHSGRQTDERMTDSRQSLIGCKRMSELAPNSSMIPMATAWRAG